MCRQLGSPIKAIWSQIAKREILSAHAQRMPAQKAPAKIRAYYFKRIAFVQKITNAAPDKGKLFIVDMTFQIQLQCSLPIIAREKSHDTQALI